MSGTARVFIALACGTVTGVIAVVAGLGISGALVGWSVAAIVIALWTHLALGGFDGEKTRTHATLEDPPNRWLHVVLLLAAVGSLAGVALVIVDATGERAVLSAVIGVTTIVATWLLVHTIATLHYAHVHYRGTVGGVDFPGSEAPGYSDFAYLAFTIGMTYQVSDTGFTTREIRRIALQHALASFVLGVVVIAVTINVVVQVASSAVAQ